MAWNFYNSSGVAKTGEHSGSGHRVLGLHQLTASQSTVSTHTTLQDEGLTRSIVYGPSRILRVSLQTNALADGGSQPIGFRLIRGSTTLIDFRTSAVDTSSQEAYFWSYTFNGPSTAATETFKVQLAASSANTRVTSYATSSLPRVLLVEDLGPQ